MPENQNTISWQAPEFRYYEKNVGWYVTLAAVAILIIGFFVIEKDLFAAISLGILTILVILFSRHKPKLVKVELSPKGVRFGDLFFPYKQLINFWVVNNQNHKTLNLHSTTYLNNIIIIELEDQEPEQIREFLIHFLPEHSETEETAIQRIMHKLKF